MLKSLRKIKKKTLRNKKRYNKNHATRKRIIVKTKKQRRLRYKNNKVKQQNGGNFNENETLVLSNKFKELYPQITENEINTLIGKLNLISQQFSGIYIKNLAEQIPAGRSIEELNDFVDFTVDEFLNDANNTDIEYDTEASEDD
jgi:hypothetical protein